MLILQADRDALLKPLQAVTGIVERRHTLPILSNVLLESTHGQTNILATDLEIQINTDGPKSEAVFFPFTAAFLGLEPAGTIPKVRIHAWGPTTSSSCLR